MGRPVPNPFEDDRRVLDIADLQVRESRRERAAWAKASAPQRLS